MLAGLLSNITSLSPRFHSTDTGGYTNFVFALCYLLGVSYQPRLKDIPHQNLYKFDKEIDCGEIDILFKQPVDIDLIKEQWDQLVRIAASLKNEVAQPHVIIEKLSGRCRSDKVVKALYELGKLVKTIYILNYISKPKLRRVVQLQLNRGESRHDLARHLFFANLGEFKTSDYEEIMNIASSLSLLSNAVLCWNTTRIAAIIENLRRKGGIVDDADIARVSPLLFNHIIVHGTYNFGQIQR